MARSRTTLPARVDVAHLISAAVLASLCPRALIEEVLADRSGAQAPGRARGAWYKGLRVMALDGSCMDVADEAVNAEFFGYPGASRGQS